MRIRGVTSIQEAGEAAWRCLEAADFPFADYEFLLALETSGSVGGETGWDPLYLLAEDGSGQLVGALCSYAKAHSYGEYIFDWDWARFYRRNSVSYYPKLLTAVPFTPATGPKLLVRSGPDADAVRAALVQAFATVTAKAGMSSSHALFLTEEEAHFFASEGYKVRHSCQYHWQNRDFRDFQDFLDALVGKRRRDVVRERRRAASHGLHLETVTGAALTDAHAVAMEALYLTTAEKKNAIPYLHPGFFQTLFRAMPDRIVLATAVAPGSGEIVAAALNFHKGKTLFGRYWGSSADYPDLHFELCYYQTIDYAIRQQLTLFEAGAQGEHKIQRGFLPALTLSAHKIEAPALRAPIETYIDEERAEMDRFIAASGEQGPFK